MNSFGKNRLNAILMAAFILAALSLTGCGDNEMAKGITDVVKKSVQGEVAKKGEEIKKQFDQLINMGTGKGQKENGQGDAKAGKDQSGEDSGGASEDEKD
jgi:hypothetical protein